MLKDVKKLNMEEFKIAINEIESEFVDSIIMIRYWKSKKDKEEKTSQLATPFNNRFGKIIDELKNMIRVQKLYGAELVVYPDTYDEEILYSFCEYKELMAVK